MFNFILRVSKYSICRRTDFVARVIPANILASSSVGNRISHKAFVLLVRILDPILRFLKLLLTPRNLRVPTLVVSRDIVLVFIASIASGMLSNSFPLRQSSYVSFRVF